MSDDIIGPTPEQIGPSKVSLDYNRYQSREGTPNQEEIKKLEQAFQGKEIKNSWNATQAEISDDRVENGRFMLGENGLSFDTKQLAMGMMASAEPAKMNGQDVIKIKYPHLKDGEVDSVSELNFTRAQYDKLRKVLRTDLEDQGLLDKKESSETLEKHNAETERLIRKTGTSLDIKRFIGPDRDYRASTYENLIRESFFQANIDFQPSELYFLGLDRSLMTEQPKEEDQKNFLNLINLALANKYALKVDGKFAEDLSTKFNSKKLELTNKGYGETFMPFRGEPEESFVTDKTSIRNRPGGQTIEVKAAKVNIAAGPQKLREFISQT